MKKKLLIVLLAITASLCFAFGLTACDDKNANSGNDGNGSNTEQSGGNTGDNGNTNNGDNTGDKDNSGDDKHSHNYTVSVIAPDCTAKGYTLHICECGDSYKDNYTDALGHTEVIDEAVEATCTQTGLTAGKHCSACDTVLVEQEIAPASGHTEVIDEAVAATCTENGLTEGKHCSVCDTVLVEQTVITVLEHNYENNVCTHCGNLDPNAPPTTGLKFSEIIKNGEVIGYSVSGIGTATETSIIIPSTYNNKPVTSIGGWAFLGCESLTSVFIPDGVTHIGNYAFSGCSGLTSVTIPDSVTSIDGSSFYGCGGITSITVNSGNTKYHSTGNCIIETESKTLVAGFKNCVIPADGSVTYIGMMAFSGCREITSVTIPDGVTSIRAWAFYNCRELTSITIPDSVTSIEGSAFENCSSLTSVKIPDSVTSISSSAFEGCSSLKSVTIPDSVTSINLAAFEGCSSLKSVNIPNSVISIGQSALRDCSGLTDINFNGTIEQWNAIKKGSSWNSNTGKYTIHCTDGDISK